MIDFIKDGLVWVLNHLISKLAAMFDWMFSLLPRMPDPPETPGIVEAVNWILPLGPILATMSMMFVLYLLWQAWLLIARWVKAV